MKKILVSVVLILAQTFIANAYPISPRPLRMLVKESQFIIVGFVVKTYESKNEKDGWSPYIAKIAVVEMIQGVLKADTIEVQFNPNMICPSPAMYFDRTYVLAFIDREKGNYYTHALSYGAKTLEREGIEIYKKRIQEMQLILKINDGEKQRAETVEWLVRCAESPVTRWEGTYELSPQSDFMSHYSRDEKVDYKQLLTDDQKTKLRSALLNAEAINYPDFGLIDIVYSGADAEIENILIKGLRSLSSEQYWFADNFFYRLQHKSDSYAMLKLRKEFEKIQFDRGKESRMKSIIDKFLLLVDNSTAANTER